MDQPTLKTLGELKASGYQPRSVRDEIRENLLVQAGKEENLFPGIIGYENTVEPQLLTGLLARHDILLLGLRGQAKTRLLRGLVRFLDPWVPVLEGSPLREDPMAPVLPHSQERIDEMGDKTPITWMAREERFIEKLATPDATISDLIGDIDPIRASRERLDLSDPKVIHFGIIPRSHRGLFCINELPDLQPRIQVGLLNILEEKDIQIRGFPIRLELDLQMLFTANPEDYTNRGRIITPLKDRIATQIITHYPKDREEIVEIFEQEAKVSSDGGLEVPPLCKEVLAEISIQARQSDLVDQSSGVSARLAITAYELLVAQVERRRVLYGEVKDGFRLMDLYACLPAISGKLELVFEGQETGAEAVAHRLIGQAIKAVFTSHFKGTGFEEGEDGADQWGKTLTWFNGGKELSLLESDSRKVHRQKLKDVPGLEKAVVDHLNLEGDQLDLAMALAVDGLHHFSLLGKDGLGGTVVYGDALSDMMQDFD